MWSSGDSSHGQRQGKAPEMSNFAQTCNLLSHYLKGKGSLRDLNLEIGGKVESLEALVKPGSPFAASASTTMSLLADTGKSHQPSSEKQPSGVDSPIIIVEDASNKASTSFSKEETTRDPKTAQLTIFYSGRVLVFDDYPAEKIKELVSVAKKGSSQMSYGITSNTIPEKPSPVASTSGARDGLPPRPQAAGGKQPVVISSNTCKEKTNAAANGKQPIVISSNTCREKMNAAASGKLPVVISSNTCREKANIAAGGDGPSSSNAKEQLSPQSEANGSDLPIARRSSLHRFLEKRRDRAAVRGPYQNREAPVPFSKDDEQQLDLNISP